MNRFKKSKLIVVVSTLVLFSLSLLYLSSQSWFRKSRVLGPLNYLISAVDGVFAQPTQFLSGSVDEMDTLLNTYKENKRLKADLSKSQDLTSENASLTAENESLRQAMSLKEAYGDMTNLTAEVLYRNPNSWSETLAIDAGSQQGITEDMLVLANGGLIGRLSDVDVTSSKVQLLTDENSTRNLAVKVNLTSGSVYGIITKYDAEKKVFIVSQLNSDTGISEGSQVVTSDLSENTASNVLVGEVAAVKKNGNTLATELHVRPAADFSNIYAVVLVRN